MISTKSTNFIFECSSFQSTTSYMGGNELWFQRSVDISLEFPSHDSNKQLLIDKCRMYDRGNVATEQMIDELQI